MQIFFAERVPYFMRDLNGKFWASIIIVFMIKIFKFT